MWTDSWIETLKIITIEAKATYFQKSLSDRTLKGMILNVVSETIPESKNHLFSNEKGEYL